MKRKNKENEKITMRQRVADSLDMSKEVILDVPKLVFIGNHEVAVENYKSIMEYTDTKIVLEAKPCVLRFTGQELELKSMAREMIFVTGKINKLEFVKEG